MGLQLNGNAATTTCSLIERNSYSTKYAVSDPTFAELQVIQQHNHELSVKETTETDNADTHIATNEASFGHRDHFLPSPTNRCPTRIRLTASQPHQRSSIWYTEPLPVLDGFESSFYFQITDHSKHCYEVKDQNFGIKRYKSCIVHGGDGFAFVIQNDVNKTNSLGNDGEQIGYGGIKNSIAVEFDTWSNPEPSDIYWDHVSIHSNGIEANSAKEDGRLSVPVKYSLADGNVHQMKVVYYSTVKYEYLEYFSSSEQLLPYLMDLSEGRRLGTLLIFADDGIQKDKPLVAIPINLATTLRLDQDLAYIGFTASTGKTWEKHDVLSWWYCANPPCGENYQKASQKVQFNTQSELFSKTAVYGKEQYSPNHPFPDTTPWKTET